MIKALLTAGRNGKELHSYDGYDDEPVLVTTDHARKYGHFDTLALGTAGARIIVEADGTNGLYLTDMIISCDKVQGGTLRVYYSDGVNDENIMLITVSDAPVTFSMPFQGRWHGWQECDLRIFEVGKLTGQVSLGYFRTPTDKTPTYAEWVAER